MKNEITYIFPANSLQQGFIYHALSQPEDDAYRVQWLYDYRKPLDIDAYVQAWNYCIMRYPILRTAFNWEEDIIQIIYKHGHFNYKVHDISHLPAQDKNAAIEAIQAEDRKQSFDLTRPTLLRVHIIKQAADHYTILNSEHHSITDGWSGPVLLFTLHEYYDALTANRKIEVKEDTAYIRAQEYISRNKQAAQQYWHKELADTGGANDISLLLSQPIDPRSYRRIEQQALCTLHIGNDKYKALKAFCQTEGITLNVVVQFAWHKILQVYSSATQSIVGTTIAGRDLPVDGIEQSVGVYINTLPLVIDWDNDNTVRIQLQEVQRKITELNTHSFADLAKLHKDGERLFHSLFIYENYPSPEEDEATSGISFRNFSEKVDYPLSIFVSEENETLTISLGYDAIYVTEEKSRQVLSLLEHTVHEIIKRPDQCHWGLTLLDAREYDEIVYSLNDTGKAFPQNKTLHELFQQQVNETPGHIALVCEDRKLTYRELDEKSNQLAHCIRQTYKQKANKGLLPDTPVALYLDRTPEMVIGILAVLKAGGAYVPIDTKYQQARIDYILNDTGAALILCQRHTADGLQVQLPQDKLLYIDLTEAFYKNESTENIPAVGSSTNLAYIIYTSGTTGHPKGVMLEHRSVVNIVSGLAAIYDKNESSKVTAYASYTFDISVSEIFASLLQGLELHILTDKLRTDTQLLSEYLITQEINLTFLPPVVLGQMPNREYPHLHSIIYAGEPCDKSTARLWSGKVRLFNYYGPTETCIYSTGKQILADEVEQIGQPAQNTHCYILNPGKKPVPVGVTGELYIGGAGVARGYLNRPDLTSERFIEDPFTTGPDKSNDYTRLYKTGDLVRWREDGNIAYVGRNDDQVKIRGYRIELGEINHALSGIKGISQNCVVVKERETSSGKHKYLAAYYVRNKQYVLAKAEIVAALSKTLPEYMVPAAYVEMDTLPLTINGKTDRKALPDPEQETHLNSYAAPTNNTEAAICRIWQEVLGLERVGITDNFYELGGDSILSIQASGRIRQVGFTNCSVSDIFKYRTAEKLAAYLDKENITTTIQTEQGILTGTSGLLPVQQWFFENADAGVFAASHHWNQSFLISVPPLAPDKLEAIITEIIAYHDVLRSHFVKERNATGYQWKQVMVPGIQHTLKTLDISKHTAIRAQRVFTEWQSNFDLAGPLVQAGYIYGYTDGSARIFFAAHHLVIDAVSWRIITDDIKTLAACKPLPPKGTSYRQWVQGVMDYKAVHPEEAVFWEQQLAGIHPLQIAPAEDEEETIALDEILTRTLLQTASKAYDTGINDLLLAALAYTLKDLDQNDTQYITLEGHGREDINPAFDVSRTVGWFTTMFPIRLELKHDIGESILSVKKHLQDIPHKGIGFGAFAVDANTTYGFKDLPLVCFNYLGQFDTQEQAWQIAAEASGNNIGVANKDPYLININGMVVNGRLEFTIATRIGLGATTRLSNSFKTWLIKVIEYCCSKLSQTGNGLSAHHAEQPNGNQPAMGQSRINGIAEKAYKVHFNPVVKIDSAALVLVTAPTSDESAFMIAHVMNHEAVLEHVLDTYWGKIGIICVPLENMNVYADRAHTLSSVKKGLQLAARLGAQTVSLTGLIPSGTNYGEAILEDISTDKNGTWPAITTGNTTTVSACVMMINRIQKEAQRSLDGEKMCFIGLGSIGSGTLRLMLNSCPHPRSITLVDLKVKREFMQQLEKEMRTVYGYVGEIDIIELTSGELPERVYDSTLFFGAASTGNILDIPKVKPGTLIVDDSDPHCFDADLAIKRFKEHHDILFTEGGALRANRIFHSSYNNISYFDAATGSRKDIDYEISPKKDIVMGCVFSSILTSKFKDVPLSIGLPTLQNLVPTFNKLVELGFEGTDLWCNDYFLEKEKMDLFRKHYAGVAEAYGAHQ